MLRYLNHAEIDFNQYDEVIANSVHPVVYAESWYLNLSSESPWDLLVYDDYEVVMPIPKARMKRSFWKKSIVQPYFAQQLGLFSKNNISDEVQKEFLDYLKNLNPFLYHFNCGQTEAFKDLELRFRRNYVLPLATEYEDIFAEFSTSKRQRVRKSKKNELIATLESDLPTFFDFQHQNSNYKSSKKVMAQKSRILSYCLKNDFGKMYFIRHNETLISVAFFIEYRKRIYYVHAASNAQGRKLLSIDFILNHVIESNAGTDKFLDFEGSEIPGVAKFMESFGAKNQPFPILKS